MEKHCGKGPIGLSETIRNWLKGWKKPVKMAFNMLICTCSLSEYLPYETRVCAIQGNEERHCACPNVLHYRPQISRVFVRKIELIK